MSWLAPFQHDFMLAAFGLGALVAAVCAVLSCFLVMKGWSLMGDAISHAVLPGMILASVAGVPLPVGAFFSGLLCAIGSGYIKNHSRVKEDTVMGVVFTGLFALGLVLFSLIGTNQQHLMHILFGNLLGIPKAEMFQTAVIGIFTLLVVLLKWKDLMLFCFDPGHARTVGINPATLNYLLLSLLALTIVAAMQAVGIMLVVAMLIIPGCFAFLMTRRFGRMLCIAGLGSVFSSVAGTYASFFLDASTGACIVLAQTALFLFAFLFAPKRGLLYKHS